MNYGFQVFNSDGAIIANDTDFNYGLYTSGTVNINGIYSQNKQTVTVNIPGISDTPVVFYRITNSARWVSVSTKILSTNTATIDFVAYNGFGTSGDAWPVTVEYRVYLPMKYLTQVDNQGTYGLVIYDEDSNKTFDSRLNIPNITRVFNVTFDVWDGSGGFPSVPLAINITTQTQPGVPWIYATDASMNTEKGGTSISTSGGYQIRPFTTAVRLIDNTLQYSYVQSDQEYNYVSGPLYWNNVSGKTYSVLLASGSNLPIFAWIRDAGGSLASCSYTSGNGCTVTKFYNVEFVGGNSEVGIYNWSLINNTGGLTISAGQAGRIVTVTKTGAAGTYSATLQCTVGYGGLNTTVSIPITFTHTQSNPITASLVSTNLQNSCNYYPSAGQTSCSTTESAYANIGGGGTGTKTYSFQLLQDAINNNFVLTGETTGTVTNGKTGTIVLTSSGSAGTRTGTVRLTVSEPGYTTLQVDINTLSHTSTASAGSVVSPLTFNTNTYSAVDAEWGFAQSSLILYSDGSWKVLKSENLSETESTTVPVASGLWFDPVIVGIGSTKECKFTRSFLSSSTIGTSTNTTDWLSLSNDRAIAVSIFWSDTTVRSLLAEYNVEIRESSTQQVVSTSLIRLRATAAGGSLQ